MGSSNGNPAPLRYYWENIPNSHELALFVSGIEIGRYNPETDTYRRVNGDGSLSGPSTKPWAQSAVSISSKPTTTPDQPVPRAIAPPPTEPLPWFTFAIGGGVTMAVLVTGFLLQGIKR